jgi:hypothetical protein
MNKYVKKTHQMDYLTKTACFLFLLTFAYIFYGTFFACGASKASPGSSLSEVPVRGPADDSDHCPGWN